MKLNMKKIAGAAADVLYPRACPVCGDILPKEAAGRDDPYICPECLEELDFLTGQCRCMRCSHPAYDGEEYCEDCREKERAFDAGFALLAHDERAKRIIYDLKFKTVKDNADVLAFELVRKAGKTAELWHAEALIPVPLHKKRLRTRGFNQAQLIAEKISGYANAAGLVIPPCDGTYLQRSRATAPQRNTEQRQRGANIENAFSVNIKDKPYGSVILVDDIFTTGSTLNECAKTLKQTGTSVVYFLTASIVC